MMVSSNILVGQTGFLMKGAASIQRWMVLFQISKFVSKVSFGTAFR